MESDPCVLACHTNEGWEGLHGYHDRNIKTALQGVAEKTLRDETNWQNEKDTDAEGDSATLKGTLCPAVGSW